MVSHCGYVSPATFGPSLPSGFPPCPADLFSVAPVVAGSSCRDFSWLSTLLLLSYYTRLCLFSPLPGKLSDLFSKMKMPSFHHLLYAQGLGIGCFQGRVSLTPLEENLSPLSPRFSALSPFCALSLSFSLSETRLLLTPVLLLEHGFFEAGAQVGMPSSPLGLCLTLEGAWYRFIALKGITR